MDHPRGRLAFISFLPCALACGGKTLSFYGPDAGSPTGAGGSVTSSSVSATTGVGGITSGAGGAGGSGPADSLIPATQRPATKVDLLFMIDNSSSMADKQSILALAVPDLLNRLVNPVCIDLATGQTTGNRNPDGSCTRGELEFDPIRDIHIGIISSSLGAHGASGGICDDAFDLQSMRTFPHNNDRAHLITRDAMDMPVATFNNLGFLNWTGAGDSTAVIVAPFTSMVRGIGQHGCGFEAQLESIYRFLIDPDPYNSLSVDVTRNPPLGVQVLNGTDMALLKQRADFLRPDSLVAVIALTDENDCSAADINGGQGFYSLQPAAGLPSVSVLGHGTSMCLINPNDPCCFNCGQPAKPGCPDPARDPECLKGAWSAVEDPLNLRCWNQKRRYGVDFLWPVGRYINGFINDTVPDRNGNAVRNPLYDDLSSTCNKATKQGCIAGRDKSLVFLAGIVGVPWQDIAVDPLDLTQGYLSATQIADMNIWPKIVGDPLAATGPVPPTDSHMIESTAPRPGLPPPTAAATADGIHGHEWDPSVDMPPNTDLQYACIFDLNPTKVCTGAADCDCDGPVMSTKSPLCQNPVTNAYSSTQVKAKAYPGIRELQVLQGLGPQAIVASICASNANPALQNAVDFGYRPAIAALVARLRVGLKGHCFPQALAVSSDGQVQCRIIEAFNPAQGQACNCSNGPGRTAVDANSLSPTIRAQGSCFCQMVQLDGADRKTCQTVASPPATVKSGWCYIDPAQDGDANECAMVAHCAATEQRLIRFVNSASEPRNGSAAYIDCPPGNVITPAPRACP